MRLLTFIVSALALIFWVGALSLGIYYFSFEACVWRHEARIWGDLWMWGQLLHKVALPAVMLSLSLISLILTSVRKRASKVVLSVSLVNLASIPVYWASFNGLAVNGPMASFCSG